MIKKVICVDNSHVTSNLTKGKVYNVIKENTEYYYLYDNVTGESELSGWMKYRFNDVQPQAGPESLDVLKAAQKAIANVLKNGGTDPEVFFDELVVVQRKIAAYIRENK
jgi:hypothetical protein